MAKKQTRRAISVRGKTYVRLENASSKIGRSVSGIVEEAVAAFLDGLGEPEVDHAEAVERVTDRTKKREAREAEAKQFFTF